MSQPWTVDGVPFLPGDRSGQAVRLPAVAVVESGLTLLRHPLPVTGDQPVGAGVVRVTLDLGAVTDVAQRAEVGLPAEVTEVVSAVVGPSVVRLLYADRELAVVEPAGGFRPVVVVGGTVGTMDATLLAECARNGAAGPLSVTVAGTLPATHGGGTAHVNLDTRPGGPDGEPTTARQVAAWIESAVEVDGALNDGTDGDAGRRVAAAAVAAHLYRPAPSAATWNLVPGWAPAEHAADAPLLPNGAPARRLRIAEDAPLPWFAATPVVLTADGLRQAELPGSRVRTLQVVAAAGAAGATMELDLGGGVPRTVEVGDEELRVRYLPGPDGSSFRWRLPGGDWNTADGAVLIVAAPE